MRQLYILKLFSRKTWAGHIADIILKRHHALSFIIHARIFHFDRNFFLKKNCFFFAAYS